MPRSIVHSLALVLLCVLVAATGESQIDKKKSDKAKYPALKGKETPVSHPQIVIETSLGTIEAELYNDDAPKTAENFAGLAKKSFFDGMRFHRVVPGFVIQAGDDKSKDLKKKGEWGTGGQSIWKKEFADELNPATPSFKEGYKKGVLAMANRGPNTNTSQFFIMLADNTTLPMNYTIFGKVIKGIEVVDKIGSVEIEPAGARDGRPKTDVMIKKISVKKPDKPSEKPSSGKTVKTK